jgi:hypothetical protein
VPQHARREERYDNLGKMRTVRRLALAGWRVNAFQKTGMIGLGMEAPVDAYEAW